MVVKEEQERVRTLISDTVTLLCRNGLSYKSKFCINALIGITLDEDDVFLVDIRETIKNLDEDSDAIDSDVLQDIEPSSKSRKHKKTSRKRPRDNVDTHAQNDTLSTEEASFDGSDHEHNDTSSEPATKNIKKELIAQEEDGDDLVFIKDEPGDKDFSSCSYGNTNVSQSFQTQQQNSDILDSLSQQGQIYATPATGNTQTSWDVSQGQLPYSQSLGLSNQPPLLPSNSQESPSQVVLKDGEHWVCQQCQKRFTCRSNVMRHMKQHLGIYNYSCQICQKGFNNKDNLHGHLASQHDMDFKVACPVCSRQFTHRYTMKNHLKYSHPDHKVESPQIFTP